MATLLVEQCYDFARGLADTLVVMDRGDIVLSGVPGTLGVEGLLTAQFQQSMFSCGGTMKTIKGAVGSSALARPTTRKTNQTLSETTYKAGLSAMKQAIRKDDRANSGKYVERRK